MGKAGLPSTPGRRHSVTRHMALPKGRTRWQLCSCDLTCTCAHSAICWHDRGRCVRASRPGVHAAGLKRQTTLIGASMSLASSGKAPLAALVALTTVIAPGIEILVALYVLSSLD